MSSIAPPSIAPPAFPALAPDEAGVVSWVHLGDLHIVHRNDESHRRLEAIVAELASSIPAQLAWLDAELCAATERGQSSAVFVHCYPTDLAEGGGRLTGLLRQHRARVVEMGHTHYNELANDGTTLFIATRSTGQIEEGPVGYSMTSIDGDAVSWRFFELGARPAVMITSPCDARLERDGAAGLPRVRSRLRVRAKAWSDEPLVEVEARAGGRAAMLERIGSSAIWEGEIDVDLEHSHDAELSVRVRDAAGRIAADTIQLALEGRARPPRVAIDQDNALEAWTEHGIVGTQLGPNKNGHDW